MLAKVGVAFVVRVFGVLAAFAMSAIAARALPIDEAGYFFLAFGLVAVLHPIYLFGTHSISLRYIGSAYAEDDWSYIHYIAKNTLLITALFGVLSSIILYFSSAWIAGSVWDKPDMEPLIVFAAVVSFLAAISRLFSHHLQSIRKNVQAIFILSVFSPLALTFYLLIFDPDTASHLFEGYILVAIINLFLGFILWKIYSEDKVAAESGDKDGSLFRACFPYWIITICNVLIPWSGQLIAARWATPEEIAFYSAALRTALLVSFVLTVVDFVFTPYFSTYYKQKKHKELVKLAQKSVLIMSVVSIPIAIFIVIFSELIMSIFGDKFVKGAGLLIILSLGQLVNAITGSVVQILNMTGHQNDMKNIFIATTILTIVGALLLTSIHGVLGAAIATALGVSAQNILAVYFVKKRLGFNMLAVWK